MQGSTLTDIGSSDFSILIFKLNYVFMEEKDNPAQKVVIDEKEIDGIVIDGNLSLENLPGAVFID